jgi:hypothetical protein
MNEKIVNKMVSEACAWAIKTKTTFELDLLLSVYLSGQVKLTLEDKKTILKTIAEIEGPEDLSSEESS